MPRRDRCILPGVACHVTQRGVDRQETFSADADRETYLSLMRQNLEDAGVGLLAWCLMTNHIHLIALPERGDSLSVLLRRVHGRYAQYYNARHGRSGHLWQNRYFACSLGPGHLWAALAYVEMNPVRAKLVERPGDYRWSSAAAHLGKPDTSRMVDMEWWRREHGGIDWEQTLGGADRGQSALLRRCTYAGRPFGDEEFVKAISEQFGRHWVRGRPKKERAAVPAVTNTSQLALFAEQT
jgi:putative transposase